MVFKTKKAEIEHFRKYLHESEEWIQLEGQAFNDVCGLIERHPSKDEKIGSGIDAIYVRRNPKFPSQRSFWIRRTDGSETDFSYLRCIDGCDKSSRHWFNIACRYAVTNQTIEFKRQAFIDYETIVCPMTGEQLTWQSCHVDHESPTFNELVDAFIQKRKIVLLESLYEKRTDGDCEVRFASFALAEDWRTFHAGNARLRVVSVKANLTRKRGR